MPKKAEPSQAKRFLEAARELGCDDDPKAFEKVFAEIVPPKDAPKTELDGLKKK